MSEKFTIITASRSRRMAYDIYDDLSRLLGRQGGSHALLEVSGRLSADARKYLSSN